MTPNSSPVPSTALPKAVDQVTLTREVLATTKELCSAMKTNIRAILDLTEAIDALRQQMKDSRGDHHLREGDVRTGDVARMGVQHESYD